MVTFICKLDKDNTSATEGLLVFFQILADWKWPTPVLLDKVKDVSDNWPFKTLLPWNPMKN